MEIELVKVADLKAYEKNSKKHSKKQLDLIKNSIKEFGFNVPILIDKDNSIIAGHGRLLASKELGIESVPAIRLENLTEAQVKAFRIADNKVAESEWDTAFLKEELVNLKALNFDIKLLGFDDKELQPLLPKEEKIKGTTSFIKKCPSCGFEYE